MPLTRFELERMIGQYRKPGPKPFCLTCGYDMRGSVSGVCPECGERLDAKDWLRELKYVEGLLKEYKTAEMFLRAAFVAVLAGVVFYLLSLLLAGACLGRCLRVLAGVLGLGGALQGAGIFRIGRLPKWAHQNLTDKPRYELAVMVIILGLIISVTVIFGP